MIRLYKTSELHMIRLYFMYNLIFFAVILFSACQRKKPPEIVILWQDRQAKGITIPGHFLDETSPDSIRKHLKVSLIDDGNPAAILGEYNLNGTNIIFEPLIPFSPGLRYSVIFRDKAIGEIEVPSADPSKAPSLLSIYPSSDTLPENLLKIYLHFSQPMREGESQKHISIIKNDRDTLRDVFLDLQPELWNEDQTILTVWLDPGRIKRDLQPNRRLGNPLQKGGHYKLSVADEWKDIQNLKLKHEYSRNLIVSARDTVSPDPAKWQLVIPRGGSVNPFEANFGEPLDYLLLTETISIIDAKGQRVDGGMSISRNESKYAFTPVSNWAAGNYILRVETHLEDLAGNNINRVFDRDINNKKLPGSKATFELPFQIK